MPARIVTSTTPDPGAAAFCAIGGSRSAPETGGSTTVDPPIPPPPIPPPICAAARGATARPAAPSPVRARNARRLIPLDMIPSSGGVSLLGSDRNGDLRREPLAGVEAAPGVTVRQVTAGRGVRGCSRMRLRVELHRRSDGGGGLCPPTAGGEAGAGERPGGHVRRPLSRAAASRRLAACAVLPTSPR